MCALYIEKLWQMCGLASRTNVLYTRAQICLIKQVSACPAWGIKIVIVKVSYEITACCVDANVTQRACMLRKKEFAGTAHFTAT